MNFFKGMILGSIVSTGIIMIMGENMNGMNLKKSGKKLMRKIEKMM